MREHEIETTLLQPWSTPVLKITLPPSILKTMIEISDVIIADKNAESFAEHLVGQIERELVVDLDILKQTGVLSFFMAALRSFVITCKCQMLPHMIDDIQREKWLVQLVQMWIVSQQPNEYNPMHMHLGCTISSVMYLKVPKMLPSRKESREEDDGSILFFGNSSRDITLSDPQLTIVPKVGDFYIFGAQQQHVVYPYRCEEGQKETERRSISFNAIFDSKTNFGESKTAMGNVVSSPSAFQGLN
jgi:hypothetical protein